MTDQQGPAIRGINTAAAVVPFRKADRAPPDGLRLVHALRQIGYTLEQAVSDLVDNSITAGATSVLIRFLHDSQEIRAVAVADDGCGMSEQELAQAMRFGSGESAPTSLGKFGMGMKLASLSHARSLTVFSRARGSGAAARRWTLEGAGREWWCQRLARDVSRDMLARKWGPLDLSRSGTVVLWEDVDKLPSHGNGLKYTLTRLDTRLRTHLGLHFHRFIESGRLRIFMDVLHVDRVGQGLHSEVAPLDPFGYAESGHPDYPKRFKVRLRDIGELQFDAHIWPPNSEDPCYRLGRRASSRQGFYFYRNNRLIQAGGWNGLVQDESEPHGSLARVMVDLPPALDGAFGLNVQKSTVIVPPVFLEITAATATGKQTGTFEEYRPDAIETYRRANAAGATPVAAYPAGGLPRQAITVLKQLYGRNEQSNGFRLQWARLRKGEFFRLDHAGHRILLDRSMRDADCSEVTKALIAMLLGRDLARQPGERRQRELTALNEMLASLTVDRTRDQCR